MSEASPATATGSKPVAGLWPRVLLWGRMIKFSHTVFALPFAVMGAFLAGRNLEELGRPTALHLVLVLICMVAARSVAMTFNRIVDASIDARNPRTAARALPAGRLSLAAVYAFLILAMLTFALGCLGFYIYFANAWPVLLGGPVLIYLCGYSFTKRFTRWSHLVLGSAIAMSPVAAWLAVHPQSIDTSAFLLMGAVTFWIAGFDVIYACQDVEVDRREGLFSLPSRLGPRRALWLTRCFHGLTVLLLLALAKTAGLGWIYLIGVALAAVLLTVENCLVKPDDLSKVNAAFFTVNGLVSLLLGACTLIDVLTHQPPVF